MLQAKNLIPERLRDTVGELLFKSRTSVKLRALPSNDRTNLRNDTLEVHDHPRSQQRASSPNTEADRAAKLKHEQMLRDKPLLETPRSTVFAIPAYMQLSATARHDLDVQQDGNYISQPYHAGNPWPVGDMTERTTRGHVVLYLDFDVCRAITDALKAHRAYQRIRAEEDARQRINDRLIAKVKTEIARTDQRLETIGRFQSVHEEYGASGAPDLGMKIFELDREMAKLKHILIHATDYRERTIASLEKQARELCATQADLNGVFEQALISANLLARSDVLPPRREPEGVEDGVYKRILDEHGIPWDENEEDNVEGTVASLATWVENADPW